MSANFSQVRQSCKIIIVCIGAALIVSTDIRLQSTVPNKSHYTFINLQPHVPITRRTAHSHAAHTLTSVHSTYPSNNILLSE